MAHKQLQDGRVVVDWETGDPEGDRKHLMQAYSDFINELIRISKAPIEHSDKGRGLIELLEEWNVSTDNQVDDFPRIWIKRP